MLPYCPSKGQATNPPWWGDTFTWFYYRAIKFVKINTRLFRSVSVLLLHVAAPMHKPIIFMMIAGAHQKSVKAAIPACILASCTLDCIIFCYRAVRYTWIMQNRRCSVKIQANLAAIFVQICALEICKAAAWPLKTSSLTSTLSAKHFNAAYEDVVPQPELRKGFKFDHCFSSLHLWNEQLEEDKEMQCLCRAIKIHWGGIWAARGTGTLPYSFYPLPEQGTNTEEWQGWDCWSPEVHTAMVGQCDAP